MGSRLGPVSFRGCSIAVEMCKSQVVEPTDRGKGLKEELLARQLPVPDLYWTLATFKPTPHSETDIHLLYRDQLGWDLRNSTTLIPRGGAEPAWHGLLWRHGQELFHNRG